MPALPPAALALLAALPILLVLGLMLGLHWSAVRAGLAGLAVAAVLVLGPFGFGDGMPVAAGFAGVLAEGAFTTLSILWILLPALALQRHQERSGGMDTLRGGLARLTSRPLLQVLLVGWFMALFFEGAAGFGTPLALAAPMLVGLGVAPVPAVALALMGHATGVSFGALGTPVFAQVSLVPLDATELAWRTAFLHACCGAVLVAAFVLVLRFGPAAGDGGASAPRGAWAWAAGAAAAFLLPSLLIAIWLGPELATLGAALLGGGLFAAVVRWRAGQGGPQAPGLWRALCPYAVLVGLVLATRMVAPLRELLSPVELAWTWGGSFSGRMQVLTHPGTLLFLALLTGVVLQRGRLSDLREPFATAAGRLLPVTVALLAMLCLSRLMLHGGLILQLERAAVAGLGDAWPWLAPAVGALGSFVTGSATASNVLFTSLQAQTAQALGLPVVLMLAAQCFGAAVGNVVCPHNIVAGAATVGLAGREAAVLRLTVWPCAIHLLAGGALVALLVQLSPAFLR